MAIPKIKPTQYSIITNFSRYTYDNVNQITKMYVGNCLTGTNLDLTKSLEHTNCVACGDSFLITSINKTINVTRGYCFINGILIEIEESSYDVTNIVNYLLENTVPIISQYVYLVIYYNPTELLPDAYMGLLSDLTLYIDNIEHMCLLGIVDITVTNDVIQNITNDDILYYIDGTTIQRDLPPLLGDGGCLGIIE